jgi:hypothetical protein
MKFQIKSRFSADIKFECELSAEAAEQPYSLQLGFAIKKAVEAGANLADADLAGADLAGADLADAYLAGAYLADARNVPETNGSESVQESADIKERQRQRAERFRARFPDVPVVENLDATILQVVESGNGKLQMDTWHTCETTHCRAGWAITLAGEAGKKLEERYGPEDAGRRIYLASTGRCPWFFGSNEDALKDLREQAALQATP